MSDQNDNVEKWEFASIEWCQFAGETGVRLLKDAKLELSQFEWGFSEEYTHTPERLMAGRDKAGYYFMIKEGEVSGGAGLPADCLSLPGFHISIPWAAIAHASSILYDQEGQKKRGADEAVMWSEIKAITGTGQSKKTEQTINKPKPRCFACGSPDHERSNCPVWPPGIGEALSTGSSEGGGLHNLTAKQLKLSPEVKDLPQTEWGVPIISKMTDDEKSRFLELLGR